MARPRKTAAPKSASSAPVAPGLDQSLARALVLLLVVVVPFLFSHRTQESFRLPKLVASETLALGSILMLAFAWARKRLPDPPAATVDRGVRVLAPVLAAACLGLGNPRHPEHLNQTLAALAIGLAACAAWTFGFDRSRLERLLTWTVVPGVGLALVGIGQFHRIVQPFSFQTPFSEGSRLAVTSLAGNAGEFGGFLLLPALVAQWRVLTDQRRRGLWIAALVVLIYGQIASQTVTSLVALVLGSAVFWLLALPGRRRWSVVGATLLVSLVVSFAAPPVRDRLAAIGDGLTVGRVNAALSGRLDGWRVAADLFLRHPVVGVGLGGYAPEFAPTRLALQERGVEFFPGHREAFFANAHNELLEWAAETGVVGLLALGFALWSLVAGVPRMAGPPEDRAFAAAALTGVALLSVAYFPLRLPLLAYPLLLWLAWLLRASTTEASS